jgi:hypothetical protein
MQRPFVIVKSQAAWTGTQVKITAKMEQIQKAITKTPVA